MKIFPWPDLMGRLTLFDVDECVIEFLCSAGNGVLLDCFIVRGDVEQKFRLFSVKCVFETCGRFGVFLVLLEEDFVILLE